MEWVRGEWAIKLGDFIGKTIYVYQVQIRGRWKVGFPCKIDYLSEEKSRRKLPRIRALIHGKFIRKSATGGKIGKGFSTQWSLRSSTGKKTHPSYIPVVRGSDSMSRLNGMSNRGMGNKIGGFYWQNRIYQVQIRGEMEGRISRIITLLMLFRRKSIVRYKLERCFSNQGLLQC